MAASLKEILDATHRRVETNLRAADEKELQARAARHQPRGFRAALERAARSGPAIIAELKKASPSKGKIRGTFPVARLALELEQAGAAALSILTEEEFFHGSLADLTEASAATHLPCLRKDFILYESQLLEARANCADAVLLIAAALSPGELKRLAAAARALALDVLCEIHEATELEAALAAGCDLIGVNSRDLRSFEVDAGLPLRLATQLPANVLRVAESGISSAGDIRPLARAGYQAFLIGESLMRAESPGGALRQMLAELRAS